MNVIVDRRQILRSAGVLGFATALPRLALADGPMLVVATFPGTWSEADRQVILPAFKQATGASVMQSIIPGADQLSRLAAAKGSKPPFDVAFLDAPQVIDAASNGLIAEYPADKSPNFKELLPGARDKWGPRITMQVIGIGYNPTKVASPPTSWDDLLNPKFRGRVGLTSLNSQLGITFLAEINRLKGGTDDNFDPAFRFLSELLPNVGAVAADLGAFATLWQQEEIDIAPYHFNFVQTLKAKEVPIELAVPASGAVGWSTSLHVVANAVEPELAVKYIDLHLAAPIQTQLMKPPYDAIPTNAKVKLDGPVTKSLAKSQEDLARIRTIDWAKINPQRAELIRRFNREIKS